MEQYYYNHMNKQKQAAYHAMLQGIRGLADEFQIPALDADALYDVFFQLRLDHPEIFWLKLYNKSSCSHFSTATGKDFGTWVIILIQAVRCFGEFAVADLY